MPLASQFKKDLKLAKKRGQPIPFIFTPKLKIKVLSHGFGIANAIPNR